MSEENKLRDAYQEGFNDGRDHQNCPWKYPPLQIAWWYSETLSEQMSEDQEIVAGVWRSGNMEQTKEINEKMNQDFPNE